MTPLQERKRVRRRRIAIIGLIIVSVLALGYYSLRVVASHSTVASLYAVAIRPRTYQNSAYAFELKTPCYLNPRAIKHPYTDSEGVTNLLSGSCMYKDQTTNSTTENGFAIFVGSTPTPTSVDEQRTRLHQLGSDETGVTDITLSGHPAITYTHQDAERGIITYYIILAHNYCYTLITQHATTSSDPAYQGVVDSFRIN